MNVFSIILLLGTVFQTEGLLNHPLGFKICNSNELSNKHERIATLLHERNYDDSDEGLFIALMNDKQREDSTMNTESASASASTSTSASALYMGAGVPRSSLNPEDIVPLLMTALKKNDFPETDAGLISMWEFASDTTKYIFQNNMTGKCPCGTYYRICTITAPLAIRATPIGLVAA